MGQKVFFRPNSIELKRNKFLLERQKLDSSAFALLFTEISVVWITEISVVWVKEISVASRTTGIYLWP